MHSICCVFITNIKYDSKININVEYGLCNMSYLELESINHANSISTI